MVMLHYTAFLAKLYIGFSLIQYTYMVLLRIISDVVDIIWTWTSPVEWIVGFTAPLCYVPRHNILPPSTVQSSLPSTQQQHTYCWNPH